jgi:hypothetical protein
MKKIISTSQFLLLFFGHEQSKEQSNATFLAQLLARRMSY